MNPNLDLFMRRKSIRAYEQQPIGADDKDQILQATLRAPTAGNMMLYSIIDVQEQAIKDRLAITCDNQPFIATAPLVLLFLADYQRWYDSYRAYNMQAISQVNGIAFRKLGVGDLMLACCDTLIAAHASVMAAEALGIGSCYIGDILEHYETHQQLFNLPPYALPVTLVCYGYPTPTQSSRPQVARYPQRYIVHTDQYHRLTDSQLYEMHAENDARFLASGPRKDGVGSVVEFNFMRKYTADFSLEMDRSVRAMLARWETGD